MTGESETLGSTEVCERLGITYRQLSHWLSKGWVPGYERPWAYSRHRFTPAEVARLTQLRDAFAKAAITLSDVGLSLPITIRSEHCPCEAGG